MLGDESDDSSDTTSHLQVSATQVNTQGPARQIQKVVSAAEVQNQTLLSSLPNSIRIG